MIMYIIIWCLLKHEKVFDLALVINASYQVELFHSQNSDVGFSTVWVRACVCVCAYICALCVCTCIRACACDNVYTMQVLRGPTYA